jgi:uncharacterized protein with beta-barrel porin domain
VQIVGANSHLNNDGIISGYSANTWGVIGGIQAGTWNGFSGGAALGYLDTTSGGADGFHVESVMPAVYARYGLNGFYGMGAASGGYHSVGQTRTNDVVWQSYNDNFSASDIGVRAEVGYDARFGTLTLTPFAAYNYRSISQAAFSESGYLVPGVWALSVNSESYDFRTWEAGARAAGWFGPFGISALAGYRGDTNQTKGTTWASMVGVPTFGTLVWGSVAGAFGNVDLSYQFRPGMTATLSLSGLTGKDYSYGAGKVRVDWTF